jgi:hypothetical protein
MFSLRTATKMRLAPAAVFGPVVSNVAHCTPRISLVNPDVSAEFSGWVSTVLKKDALN